jgi:hypothetical protein|eukprot:COSAG06_NODE_1749_length_8472_cov_6.578866_6_plen_81_part_00
MWGYGGCLCYDFAAVAVAWGLGLSDVKQLVRNSILCSTLRGVDQVAALSDLMRQWDAWVEVELGQQQQQRDLVEKAKARL